MAGPDLASMGETGGITGRSMSPILLPGRGRRPPPAAPARARPPATPRPPATGPPVSSPREYGRAGAWGKPPADEGPGGGGAGGPAGGQRERPDAARRALIRHPGRPAPRGRGRRA